MWEMPKALKSGPKSNKSPNLVTLQATALPKPCHICYTYALSLSLNFFLKKMGQSRPLFVYFHSFLVTMSIQIEISVDGVLGI